MGGITNKRIKNGIIALVVILVAGLILGTGIGILYWGESTGWLAEGITKLEGMGYVANLIIIMIFIPTSFPLIPGYALLPIISGYLFGFGLGLITTIIGSQLGFLAVFLVVNFLLRKKTEEFVEKKGGKYVKAIMKEIVTHRVKFAFLLRVLPVPIGLQNCVLSISPIPLWMYQIVSGCGLLVKQVPEVYLGTQLGAVADIISGSGDYSFAQILPIIIGIVGVVVFLVFIVFISNRIIARLKTMEEEELDAAADEFEDDEEIELDECEARIKQVIVPLENEIFASPDASAFSGIPSAAGVDPSIVESASTTESIYLDEKPKLNSAYVAESILKASKALPVSSDKSEFVEIVLDDAVSA